MFPGHHVQIACLRLGDFHRIPASEFGGEIFNLLTAQVHPHRQAMGITVSWKGKRFFIEGIHLTRGFIQGVLADLSDEPEYEEFISIERTL